jgi:flagellar hook assembly protein FlgD
MVRTPGVLVTRLLAPMPNPTASGVAIQMDVAADVPDARLAVYDVSGREVRVLADGPLGRGRVTVRWDGRDGCGHEAASGVYFVRLVAAEARAVCRMSVVR